MRVPCAPDPPDRFLAERVLPVVWPGRALRSVACVRASLRRSGRCVASYALWLGPSDGPDPEYVTITWAPIERLRRIRRKRYDDRDRRAPGGAFLLSEEPCLVEVFPADHKVVSLGAAVSLPSIDRGAGWEPVRRVRVLRYRAHRCAVLRYETDGGPAIGKVYARASVAEEVRAKLASLGPQARARGFALPRPLTPAGPPELVLMEYVTGDELAAGDGDEARDLVRAAARTLRAFRSLELERGPRRTIAGDLARLADRAARLAPGDALLQREAAALIERLEARVATLGHRPESTIHGDFKPDQLLVRDDGVVVVDLDRAGRGDPAIDAGNFAACLEERAVLEDGAGTPSPGAVFLDAVAGGRPARVAFAIALARRGVRALERDLARRIVTAGDGPGRRLLRRAAEEADRG